MLTGSLSEPANLPCFSWLKRRCEPGRDQILKGLKNKKSLSIIRDNIFMKLAVALVVLAMAGLVETAQESKAQTVRDTAGGRTYFENAVKALCGSGAHISVSSDSAFIFLSGEYIENRNLNEIARNLALDGLNAFPDSEYFYVDIEDAKGRGHADAHRRR